MSSTKWQRPRVRGRVRAACAMLLVALSCALGSCSSDGGDDQGTAAAPAQPAPRYGYAPSPDAPFTYKPDVVILGGGGAAVRSVSANGLAWTIDGRAPGARDLSVGKIMFATSDAVGRVVKIDPSGEDLVVTLAPVELTDIVQDGRITFDEPVDVGALTFQAIPDFPGAFETGNASIVPQDVSSNIATTVILPTLRLRPTAAGDLPPPEQAESASATLGEWDVTAVKGPKKVGYTASKGLKQVGDLKLSATLSLLLQDLRIRADVPIAHGQIGPSKFIIDGITGISFELTAGAENGGNDNRKVRIEFPIEITKPVIIAGFPAVLKQKFKFLAETAFTTKNSILSANGLWRLDGPLGFDGQTFTLPTFSTEKSVLDSIQGVSLGINGVITAVEFRFSLGLGLPVASAGPYATLVASIGVSKGSAVGLVECRQATLVLRSTGGVGVSMSGSLKKALELALKVKVPEEMPLFDKELVNRTQASPPLCAAK